MVSRHKLLDIGVTSPFRISGGLSGFLSDFLLRLLCLLGNHFTLFALENSSRIGKLHLQFCPVSGNVFRLIWQRPFAARPETGGIFYYPKEKQEPLAGGIEKSEHLKSLKKCLRIVLDHPLK